MRKRIVKRRKRIKQGTGAKRNAGQPPVNDKGGRAGESCSALVEMGCREVYGAEPVFEENSTDGSDDIPIDPLDEEAEGVPVSRRQDILRLVCGFVVVFSVFSAVVIACFAFAVAVKHNASGDEPEATVGEELDSGEGKVVFVRPYDDESGILTAPEIYEKCAPSVVSVSVKASAESGGEKGIGTGFVISEDGYIATAAHVTAGAEELFVVFSDGKSYGAELIAENEMSDIALLKIEASGLVPLEFGLSSELLTGERVYAIGTPAALEYSGTLTSGEVSYPNRILPVYTSAGELEKKLRLIQTNAQLNAGSSGSPLIDEYGKVVGIVTMKLGDGYLGIGFAIPSDGAARILEAMMSGRTLNSAILSGAVISAPKLGVVGESVVENQIYGYKIKSFSDSGSGAAGALKIGDLIVDIDGLAVYGEGQIAEAVNKKSPGDTVSVTVLRSGQRLTFDIILGS